MRKFFSLAVAVIAMTACSSKQEVTNPVFTMDTHLHVDVPMEKKDMPGPDVDLRTAMQKAGMNAVGMTFAVDYVRLKYTGHALERFNNALDGQDAILKYSKMKRALNGDDLREAVETGEPIAVQCVEGAHFLEGDTTRIKDAYDRGLRVFCLLHDNDAAPALGDVYTNEPKFGGLTELGAATIRECERLGILVDLAHCDSTTIVGALKVATKPVVVSHTGLSTLADTTSFMGKMMAKRTITPHHAKMIADKGGVIGFWPHEMHSPEEFAKGIRAMVDIVGIDHVCIGTDSKITEEIHEWEPWGEDKKDMGPKPEGDKGPRPEGMDEGPHDGPRPDGKPMGDVPKGDKGDKGDAPKGMPQHDPNAINHVWNDAPDSFFPSVIRCLTAEGFSDEDIRKICGENFLRVFDEATKK